MSSQDADETIRFEIAAARRIMAAAGLDRDDIAGQVTARVAGEDSLWTTTMDLFDATRPEHVVNLAFGVRADDVKRVEVDGSAVPITSAAAWVEAIYRARPDVGCIIHTHAPYIGAVASTGEVVGMYNNRSVIFYGEQAFYDDDGTGTDSPERIVDALGSRSVLIQRNHGAVITGPNVRVAAASAVLLEAGARFHVLALAAGGKPFPDNDAFLARKRPHRANLELVWDAHLRRLRRSAPEIFSPV